MSDVTLPDLKDNPWVALFPSVLEAQKYAATWRTDLEPKSIYTRQVLKC